MSRMERAMYHNIAQHARTQPTAERPEVHELQKVAMIAISLTPMLAITSV